VPRDLEGFFLELFPFCGCDRFAPRGDQGRKFFLKRQAVLRAFDKFVVQLNGVLAVDFVIGTIVPTVFWGLHSAVGLFNECRAIRLREPN